MRTHRREIEGISLSFLDVISCGFGAIILMLVLTKVFEPIVLEESIENLEGYLAALQQELEEIRGETTVLNRELIRREDKRAEERDQLSTLQAELTALRASYEATQDKTELNTLIEGRLAEAKQELTDEMERLLASYESSRDNERVLGIPADSEYVIFIIDTSGSMFTHAWPLVIDKLQETLEIYPQLKGIQVMNDQGDYMFSQYAGSWIRDTAARRAAILERMATWNAFSNSSPEQGIIRAISTFYQPGRKISLYVFGDDFRGRSIRAVVDAVDRINMVDQSGDRLVRIHGIGFPVIYQIGGPRDTEGALKFAHLMRILCERNGGTFVGLNDYRLL